MLAVSSILMLTSCHREEVSQATGGPEYWRFNGDLKVKHPYGGYVYLDVEKLLAGHDADPVDGYITRSQNAKLKLLLSYSNPRSLAKFIAKYADDENDNSVSWKSLVQAFPDLDPVSNSLPEDCVYSYMGYIYRPIVFFVNHEWADTTLLPVFSDGLLVDDDDINNDHDQALAYALEQDSSYTAVLIGETSMLNVTRPIFSMSLEVCGIDSTYVPEELTSPETNGGILAGTRSPGTSTNEFQIKHRYDNTRYSEFHMAYAKIIKLPGEHQHAYKGVPGEARIANVHKDDIGKHLSKWKFWTSQVPLGICGNPVEERWAFVYNTYEEDRWNSRKFLGKTRVQLDPLEVSPGYLDVQLPAWGLWDQWNGNGPIKSGVSKSHGGNRRYAHEWYSYSPRTDINLPNCYLKTPYFCDPCWGDNSYGWAHIMHFEEDKGYIWWWKVQ